MLNLVVREVTGKL